MSKFIEAVIKVANEAYPDGEIAKYYEDDDATGDTLAQFIVREITEVCEGVLDEKAACKCAVEALDRAGDELEQVKQALLDRLWSLTKKEEL